MRVDHATDMSLQFTTADRLLTLGLADDAQRVIDGVLLYREHLTEPEVIRSCGLLGRLLALRGDRVRARMFAALSVELARCTKLRTCQETARRDQADTLRVLGEDAPAHGCQGQETTLATGK